MYNLSLIFTSRQLTKHYMHIGVNYRNVNRNNSYYLLGIYKNVSIINLSRILPVLKKKFFFFFKFMLSSYSNIFLINCIENIGFKKVLKKKFETLKISYFFGRWWNGFVYNYKTFILTNLKKDLKLFDQFPSFIFYVPVNDELNDASGYAANAEFNSAGVNSIVFFDTHKSFKNINSGVMQNTKTLLNNFFLTYLIISVYKKLALIKKKQFYIEVIEKWKTYDRTLFLQCIFAENFYDFHSAFLQYEDFFVKKIGFKNIYYKNKFFFKTWKDFLK